MTKLRQGAITVFQKVFEADKARTAKVVKYHDKQAELQENVPLLRNALSAVEAKADEIGVKIVLGEVSPQELDQINAQRTTAAQALATTELMISAIGKEITKLESLYDPSRAHPVEAARAAVYRAAYEEERDALRRHLPLIRRAYIYLSAANGNSVGSTFDWDIFLRTLEFGGPSKAEISQAVKEIEGLLEPADSEQATASGTGYDHGVATEEAHGSEVITGGDGEVVFQPPMPREKPVLVDFMKGSPFSIEAMRDSEQATAGSIQDRQQSSGTGIVGDQGDRK